MILLMNVETITYTIPTKNSDYSLYFRGYKNDPLRDIRIHSNSKQIKTIVYEYNNGWSKILEAVEER